MWRVVSGLMFVSLLAAAAECAAAERYFTIRVVDEASGRGVPLVELETVNHIRHVTDSNGVVAFHEPGLMDQEVFFHVRSHGYEFPKDGFGFAGKALRTTPGTKATLKIRRINLAERLYRVTGAGIYRDSILAGEPAPLREPVLNAQVLGSDSVVNAVYRGKIHWFWGDTNRPSYPLGNFHVPGATSELPDGDRNDPERGIDLSYFTDEKGFARATAEMPGPGPTWIDGLTVLRTDAGERMFCAYAKIKPPLTAYEHGVAEWNDTTKRFERRTVFPPHAPVLPSGHTFLHTVDSVEYVYCCAPYPLVRVRATADDLLDSSRYESFTCLKAGSALKEPELDRDERGRIRYAWKPSTPALDAEEQERLLRAGRLRPEDALLRLVDRDSGRPVLAHRGSVAWNAWRQRWVMICVQKHGTSELGEVWYAEADSPAGPWSHAVKVVTHDRYSFYNPRHHPMFDRNGGRAIYFEGTYTNTFSGNREATPRYEYNQLLYRLDLTDERLVLPVPFAIEGTGMPQRTSRASPEGAGMPWDRVAFFASDRAGAGTIPVFVTEDGGVSRLQVGGAAAGDGKRPLFHAIASGAKGPSKGLVALWEFRNADGTRFAYSTDRAWTREGFARQPSPVCLVWSVPSGEPARTP